MDCHHVIPCCSTLQKILLYLYCDNNFSWEKRPSTTKKVVLATTNNVESFWLLNLFFQNYFCFSPLCVVVMTITIGIYRCNLTRDFRDSDVCSYNNNKCSRQNSVGFKKNFNQNTNNCCSCCNNLLYIYQTTAATLDFFL